MLSHINFGGLESLAKQFSKALMHKLDNNLSSECLHQINLLQHRSFLVLMFHILKPESRATDLWVVLAICPYQFSGLVELELFLERGT